MADTNTPNLALVKMGVGTHRDSWGDVANANLDKIDAAAGAVKATADAALPKAGGTISGEVLRAGQGALPHWSADALDDATMFLTPSGAPSPLTAPGQIWFGYSS